MKNIRKDILKIIDNSGPIFFCSSTSNIMTKKEHLVEENGIYEMKAAIYQNIENYFDPEIPPYNNPPKTPVVKKNALRV
jgi:hypothetical protein